MSRYYMVVNLDKREVLEGPEHSPKEHGWNWPNGRPANVVLWALWSRWNGDRIAVLNDTSPDMDDRYQQCVDEKWPNVWAEVEADFLRFVAANKLLTSTDG